MGTGTTIALEEESDVRLCTEAASKLAINLGLGASAAAEISLAVSEVAQNAIRYAGHGKVNLSSTNYGRVLNITVKDDGPGIPDLDKAMAKGFSSNKTSLGIGLDVASRSVDEFEIQSDADIGTQVTMRKFLPIPEETLHYGVVSMADERYAINGDTYLIKEYDGDKALMAVIDGTGEGYPAHAAALVLKEFLQSNYRLPLDELVKRAHQVLHSTGMERGATLALARVTPGQLEYLGIGDSHGYWLSDEMRSLYHHEGTVGMFQLPTLRVRTVPIEEDTYFILCTDGIRSNLGLDGHQTAGPQQVANTIFREFAREYGDVTVLVAKYCPTP